MKRTAALLALALALAACTSTPPAPVAQLDLGWYASAKQVLKIDPAASLISITVRRAGPLARLGHDHVIAARRIEGKVAPLEGRADLRFALADLIVDETGLRQQAKLDTTPSAEAIAGTRENMLKTLEADRFPLVLMRAEGLGPELRISITLHGQTRSFTVPVLRSTNSGSLRASGAFVIRQSDFGITPMSVLGGAMRVADELELQFDLLAH